MIIKRKAVGVVIKSWVRINKDAIVKDGKELITASGYKEMRGPEDVYRHLGLNYMKFFKMDVLCKWAWLGAELLLDDNGVKVYEGVDPTKIAVALMTDHGCIDVDKKYKETIKTIPSPALFVYTLPNIMLGEICIRHGFKGEQSSLVSEGYDTDEQFFWVNDLLQNRGMDACIMGWVDAYNNDKDVCLFWVTKDGGGTPFTANAIKEIYSKP